MLANLFKKKKKALLGIDISSSAVKILELSENNGRYQVEAYASEALPEDAIVEHSISNDEAVGETVRRALTRSRAGSKHAAIAMPGQKVIVKTMQINSALKENEMDFQVRAEVDIPFSLDEVALDWEIQGSADGDLLDVLVVASHNDAVDRRKSAAEYANLEVKVIDVEAYCIERAYELIKGQLGSGVETVAIVDIGATTTTLNVLHEGKSIYTRDQMFGGDQLTMDICRHYALSKEEANRAKFSGTLPDDYTTELLDPFRQAVVQQVSRAMQFFYSASRFNDVDYIVLAGGTAATPMLAEKVQEQLGIATIVANPFQNVTLSNKVNPNVLNNDAPSLLIACGLAMRSID